MRNKRIFHRQSGLYWESGHGPHGIEMHVFLSENSKEPIQICKSILELAAFLIGFKMAVDLYRFRHDGEKQLIVPSWGCRFCGLHFTVKEKAINHAFECEHNKDVRSCMTCKHHGIQEMDYDGYRHWHVCGVDKARMNRCIKHCPDWEGKE